MQDSGGGEESDFNFESKPQQQQESKENPDQARNQAKVQMEQNKKQQFSHIPVFSESTKIDESINIHHSPQNRSIKLDHDTSAGDEECAQKNAISVIAAFISSSSVTIVAAGEHKQNKNNNSVEVSASAKRKEEVTTPLGQNDNEDGGASAEGREAVVNTGHSHGHSGKLHDSPRTRDQEGDSITGVMDNIRERELRDQERDDFSGGGGSNNHRRALPLVARPPVLLAASFSWMRESEIQSEPIAGDAEASKSTRGELKKKKVVALGGGFGAAIPLSEGEKMGRGRCGDVGLGYGLILGPIQILETQIKKKNAGVFNLGPNSKLAGFFGQLQFFALMFYLVDGLRLYQWDSGGIYIFLIGYLVVPFIFYKFNKCN